MSPLNLLAATCTRMYHQHQPFVSAAPAPCDGYVPQDYHHHHYPASYSNYQYWFQHSPPAGDVAISGFQPQQPQQQQYQWQGGGYGTALQNKVEMELGVSYVKARRCIKCQCPNCLGEESGLRKPQAKKVSVRILFPKCVAVVLIKFQKICKGAQIIEAMSTSIAHVYK